LKPNVKGNRFILPDSRRREARLKPDAKKGIFLAEDSPGEWFY